MTTLNFEDTFNFEIEENFLEFYGHVCENYVKPILTDFAKRAEVTFTHTEGYENGDLRATRYFFSPDIEFEKAEDLVEFYEDPENYTKFYK